MNGRGVQLDPDGRLDGMVVELVSAEGTDIYVRRVGLLTQLWILAFRLLHELRCILVPSQWRSR